VVPTPPLEFPEPKLGTGEPAAGPAASGAAPAPAQPPAGTESAPATAPSGAAAVPAVPPAVEAAAKPAPPKKFKVQFSSVPIATVAVDGKNVGNSLPAKTLSLEEGEHKVRFTAAGHPTFEKTFRVGPGGENRIHHAFPMSTLVIEAPDWAGARVLVDGKFKGMLPAAGRLRLPPGKYSVTLSREGVNPLTERVEIPDEKPKTWTPKAPSGVSSGGS
jgi:hypothetical protein